MRSSYTDVCFYLSVHLMFLSLLLTIAYGEKNLSSFHFNSAINQTFTPSFNHIRSTDDFYFWANKLLLPKLYGSYEGKHILCEFSRKKVAGKFMTNLRIWYRLSFQAMLSLVIFLSEINNHTSFKNLHVRISSCLICELDTDCIF